MLQIDKNFVFNLRFTNILKNGPKIYYRCENEPKCLKRCYIKFPELSNPKYEIFQCEMHHLHSNKQRLSKRSSHIANLILENNLTQPLDSIKISTINSEIKKENLPDLSSKQLHNLKYRLKKKK